MHNFRSYELYETELSERGTIIVGPNGIGKTNLLEAIYISLRSSSFRASLGDCMRLEADQSTILLNTTSGQRRLQLYREDETCRKVFTINDKKSKLLTRKDQLPVVLFEPNELRLITSSPSRRRDFLDGLLSRLSPEYERTLRVFNRTLLQRNELLKQADEASSSWRDHLFAWDIKFTQLATWIAKSRANFLSANQAQLKNLYQSLSGAASQLEVEYISCVPLASYEQSMIDKLQRSRDYDIATGHTSSGPHREDFLLSLHSQPAIKVASRGETRTIMLAFKLLELELQTKNNQTKPIVLLDDVFSELDGSREQLLQEAIKNHQFIITSTNTRQTTEVSQVIQLA